MKIGRAQPTTAPSYAAMVHDVAPITLRDAVRLAVERVWRPEWRRDAVSWSCPGDGVLYICIADAVHSVDPILFQIDDLGDNGDSDGPHDGGIGYSVLRLRACNAPTCHVTCDGISIVDAVYAAQVAADDFEDEPPVAATLVPPCPPPNPHPHRVWLARKPAGAPAQRCEPRRRIVGFA